MAKADQKEGRVPFLDDIQRGWGWLRQLGWLILALAILVPIARWLWAQKAETQPDRIIVANVAAGVPKWLLLDSPEEGPSNSGCPDDQVTRFEGTEVEIVGVTEGCATELSLFADGFAPVLMGKPGWTSGRDNLTLELPSLWSIDVKIVGEYPEAEDEARKGIDEAIALFGQSGMGLALTMKTDVVIIDPADDPRAPLIRNSQSTDEPKCGDAIMNSAELYTPGSAELYVFFVQASPSGGSGDEWQFADDDYGWTCTTPQNVIFVRQGARVEILAHEIGHALSLAHAGVGFLLTDFGWTDDNLMQSSAFTETTRAVGHLSLGQAYRTNFNENSWLNRSGVRSGETTSCQTSSPTDKISNSPSWPCPHAQLDWP